MIRRAAVIAVALGAVLLPAAQADEATPQKQFRVCRDPNNLPFSNARSEGFEDRIAKVMAEAMGATLGFYDFASRMNFVRNTLKFKLPGDDYHCDVMMGVAVGFDQVAQTRPYYRSTYALVIPQGRKLDAVKSVDALLALTAEQRAGLRIGVIDRSPASDWLVKHDLLDQGVPFKLLVADLDQTSPGLMEAALVKGDIDAAIVWGPLAGDIVRSTPSLRFAIVPMASEPSVRFDYPIAIGLRHGEKDRKAELEATLDRVQPKIDAILSEYQVPTLPLPPPRAAGDGK